MKTIAIFTSSQGHKSISDAIAEKIKKKAGDKYKIETFFKNPPLGSLYKSVYRFAPKAFGKPFHTTAKILEENEKLYKKVSEYFDLNIKKDILEFVQNKEIDLVISTHPMYEKSLASFQEKNKTPYFNIIADPRTIHPISFSKKAKYNFIFNEEINEYYLDNYQNKTSGWFVQKKFEEKYDKEKIKKKLKVKDGLNLLIVSGSDGSNMILKLLPTIINCPSKTNFFIACGTNQTLYKSVLGIKRSIEKLSNSKANIITLTFTKDLHQYMQLADLVIGKAGPNTLFESIATETPFFAITHMHGQEDGNLDLIEEYNLGIVEEKSKEANQKILDIIQNPKQIKDFTSSIKEMKSYNQKSIDVLLKEIDRELKN